jgi:tetratricopeptide (TPR) repeat protein
MDNVLITRFIANRYQPLDILGKGGMGTVYRALDRLNGGLVALKRVTIPSEQLDFGGRNEHWDNLRLALAHEFRVLASLRHPNIISVLNYGFDENQPYFTMDMLENGQTIVDFGGEQLLSVQINLILQILQALAYLHRRGILHRDLKPSNVLVVNGQVKLLDFGIAMIRGENPQTSGTLPYMAPEVLMGDPASEASDLYAVGVMVYELFAKRHPFDVENAAVLVQQILATEPDIHLLPVNDALKAVIKKLLVKDPQARYNDAYHVFTACSAATGQEFPYETPATRESFLQAAQFVGREQELQQLSNALREALNGRGSAWLIGGESGIGKSRLLDELRTIALVDGALVLRGQAVGEGGMLYLAWRDTLRQLCLQTELSDLEASVLKAVVSDIEALLERPVQDAPILELLTAQERLLQVIDDIFSRQSQPIVIILEDIHWAGSESIAILKRLTHRVKQLRLLLIASCRSDHGTDLLRNLSDMQLLMLERLSKDKIGDLSASMLGYTSAYREQIIALLNRETEGNIFFIVEVVRALAEEVGQLDRIGTMALPERIFPGGVKQIIQSRLNRVPEAQRAILRFAAAIGRQLDLKILQTIQPDLNNWLSICADASVIEIQDGQWRFSHDKLREGLEIDLQPQERQALHQWVAVAIEHAYPNSPEQTAALAHHWKIAGNIAKEAHYTYLAGEQALRNNGYQEAVALLKHALVLHEGLNPQPSLRASAEKYLGEAYYALAQINQSRIHLALALKSAHRPLPETRAKLVISLCSELIRQIIHRILGSRLLKFGRKSGPVPIAMLLYGQIALIAALVNDMLLSLYTTLSMLNLAERVTPSPELARAYVNVAYTSGLLPIHTWAQAYNRRALAVAEKTADPSAQAWVLEISSLYNIGICRLQAASEGLTLGIKIADQIGDQLRREEVESLLTVVHYYQGNFVESRDLAKRLRSTIQSPARLVPLLQEAQSILRLGNKDYAAVIISLIEGGLDTMEALNRSEMRVWGYGLLGLAYFRQGKYQLAAEKARTALQMTSKLRPTRCYSMEGFSAVVETYFGLWEAEYVETDHNIIFEARQAYKAFRKHGRIFPISQARGYLWEGVYHRLNSHLAQARKALSASIERAKKLDLLYEQGLASYQFARHLEPGSHLKNEYLTMAYRIFETLHAAYDAEQVQRLLVASASRRTMEGKII